jgi:hypothetical protein
MKIFYKVDVDAIRNFTTPIIAQIGAENWATLCVLSAYMNENKTCYPTYRTLSTVLGISPTSVSNRIRKLEKCTYNNKPVMKKTRNRNEQGKWGNNVYEICTDAIHMFNTPHGDN